MELPDFMKARFSEAELAKMKLTSYEHEGLAFIRLAADHKGYPRGTVFHEDGIVPGYPKIMRVLHLERGIKRYFKGPFYAEEKVDGYNVRVAVVTGEVLAFTRGGFVCPFTTDRIPELIDVSFLTKNPGLVLCGEVVGPGSPYNTEEIPYVEEDVKFYAFGVMDTSIGIQMSPDIKYTLLQQHGIPQVRHWGFHPGEIEKIKALVLELDADGREGIVLKPSGANASRSKVEPIKYVTPTSCIRDIEATSTLMAELPAGFYIQRIMRAIFFSREFGLPLSDDYLMSAARALFRPNLKLLKDIDEGGEIRETFTIRVKEKEAVDELLHRLRQANVAVTLTSIEKTDQHLQATFHRTYRKGTKDLRRKLSGHGFFD